MKTREFKSEEEIVSANFKNRAIFKPDFKDTDSAPQGTSSGKSHRKHFSFKLDLTSRIIANFGPRGRALM
jgi:hypothetical protein